MQYLVKRILYSGVDKTYSLIMTLNMPFQLLNKLQM